MIWYHRKRLCIKYFTSWQQHPPFLWEHNTRLDHHSLPLDIILLKRRSIPRSLNSPETVSSQVLLQCKWRILTQHWYILLCCLKTNSVFQPRFSLLPWTFFLDTTHSCTYCFRCSIIRARHNTKIIELFHLFWTISTPLKLFFCFLLQCISDRNTSPRQWYPGMKASWHS